MATPELSFGPGPIPASLYSSEPRTSESVRFRPYSLTLEAERSMTSGYQWKATSPVLHPGALAAAEAVALSSNLLQLPIELPARVTLMARRLTADKRNDFERLEAIRIHLRNNYTYDLDNLAAPAGKDAVDYFLFEDPRGVCAAFSSAFVVLARAAGFPARVVGGWAISPTDDQQTVRAKQAHQWAEVPFEGLPLGQVRRHTTRGSSQPRQRFRPRTH